jgi:hypothetical protein
MPVCKWRISALPVLAHRKDAALWIVKTSGLGLAASSLDSPVVGRVCMSALRGL